MQFNRVCCLLLVLYACDDNTLSPEYVFPLRAECPGIRYQELYSPNLGHNFKHNLAKSLVLRI